MADGGEQLLSGLFKELGWIDNNVIGLGVLNDSYFNPMINKSPITPISGSVPEMLNNGYDAYIQVYAPSDNDIKALDDFFEYYGYRINRVMKPNLCVRDRNTFVKTSGAVVISSNRLAVQQLSAMLNNGCNFWKGEIGK